MTHLKSWQQYYLGDNRIMPVTRGSQTPKAENRIFQNAATALQKYLLYNRNKVKLLVIITQLTISATYLLTLGRIHVSITHTIYCITTTYSFWAIYIYIIPTQASNCIFCILRPSTPTYLLQQLEAIWKVQRKTTSLREFLTKVTCKIKFENNTSVLFSMF